MLCPFCGKRTDSRLESCQHCGKSLRAPRRTKKNSADAPGNADAVRGTGAVRGTDAVRETGPVREAPLRVYEDEAYLRPPRRAASPDSVRETGPARGADAVRETDPARGADAVRGAGAARGTDAVRGTGSVREAPLRVYGDAVEPPLEGRPAGRSPSVPRRRGASAPPAPDGQGRAQRASRGASTPPGAPPRRGGSGRTEAAGKGGQPVRVRHSPRRQATREMDHERLEQIVKRGPVRKKRVKWGPMVGGILLFAAAVGVSTTLLLTQTASGQRQLAAWGYDVPASAYMSLGGSYLDTGEIARSIAAYERAREIEPDSVEAALDLASVYEIDGRQEDAVAIYTELMDTLAPQHVEAYTRMIRIFREAGEAQQAVDLMKRAYEATGSDTFETMRQEYMPSAPVATAAVADKKNAKEFELINNKANVPYDITLSAAEGTKIYYTLDDSDPSEEKTLYQEGEKIRCEEGTTHLRAVAISETGVPSDVLDETYQVIIKTPDAPKANYAPGPYQRVISVSLRASEDIVAIYYTLDGTSPTTDSLLYTGPITLPVGKSTLKAIALSETGKQSYEMTSTYEITGTQKRVFNKDDTFKNLTLMKTKYAAFKKTYGEPERYGEITGEGAYGQGQSFEAAYADKTARFVSLEEGKDPVLYYLETRDSSMTGPRKTKVSSEEMTVLNAFRDKGGMPVNDRGDRLLYNIDSKGEEIGTYRVQDDGSARAQYFYPAGENVYVELTYTIRDGAVESILWQRYLGVTE